MMRLSFFSTGPSIIAYLTRHTRCVFRLSGCAAILLYGTLVTGAWADIHRWDAGTGNWSTAGNWDPAQEPVAGDGIRIDNGGTAQITTGNDEAGSYCYLGTNSADTGTLAMSGGSLDCSSSFKVGYNGEGTLNLSGGILSNILSTVGERSGATGTVIISGSGSWEAVSLYLGGTSSAAGGQGSVSVTGGDITLTDTLKLWESTDTLTLDGGMITTENFDSSLGTFNHHDGTLTVSGGSFSDGESHLNIDGDADGNPHLVLDDIGSFGSSYGAVSVGGADQGKLTVSGGTVLANSGSGYLGEFTGSAGTVLVTGSGSQWNIAQSLYAGYAGVGSLSIENGGVLTVSNAQSVIGSFAGSDGTVTVTGSDSRWTSTYSINVGYEGSGILDIQDGAEVSSGSYGLVGTHIGSDGEINIDGAGSTLSIYYSLFVGGRTSSAAGDGSVSVTSGGELTVAETLWLWDTGILTLDGGSVTTESFDSSRGTFNHHDGTLTVSGGSFSDGESDLGVSGDDSGDLPHLVLDDIGSFGSSYSSIIVGDGADDKGSLTISGGTVLNHSSSGYVGYSSGSTGTVLVTDSGSQWNCGAFALIGSRGTGALTIQDGGVVSISTSASVGTFVDSSGEVTVTGTGSEWICNYAVVGEEGHGVLNIQNGASVSWDTFGFVGLRSGSNGEVTVDGAGSTLAISENFYVGGDSSAGGTGSVSVTNSGEVNVTDTLKLWNTGTLNLTSGTLDADELEKVSGATFTTGSGSTLRVNVLTGFGTTPSFNGSLDLGSSLSPTAANYSVSNGESLTVGQTLSIGQEFKEATLTVSGTGVVSATQVIVKDGDLKGSGTVQGALTVYPDGTIAPGESVGTLTITGNAVIAGIYDCEVDGATADRLTISGSLDLTNHTIDFSVLNAPTEASYIIASAASITGTPATTNVPDGYEVNVSTTQITLQEDVPTPYETWADAMGLTSGVNDGFTDNPDGDRYDNITEFALGGSDPLGAGSINLPVDRVSDSGGSDYLSMTLLVRGGATFNPLMGNAYLRADQDGAGYELRGLSELTALEDRDLEEVTPALTSGLPSAPSGWEYRTFRLALPVTSQPRGFIELNVSATPE
jgi:T5SS/PEP-CTERM-associated repeat protein